MNPGEYKVILDKSTGARLGIDVDHKAAEPNRAIPVEARPEESVEARGRWVPEAKRRAGQRAYGWRFGFGSGQPSNGGVAEI